MALEFDTVDVFTTTRFGGNPLAIVHGADALDGAAMQMFTHGIITGMLFFLVGMIYERYHTKEIARLRGKSPEEVSTAGMLRAYRERNSRKTEVTEVA